MGVSLDCVHWEKPYFLTVLWNRSRRVFHQVTVTELNLPPPPFHTCKAFCLGWIFSLITSQLWELLLQIPGLKGMVFSNSAELCCTNKTSGESTASSWILTEARKNPTKCLAMLNVVSSTFVSWKHENALLRTAHISYCLFDCSVSCFDLYKHYYSPFFFRTVNFFCSIFSVCNSVFRICDVASVKKSVEFLYFLFKRHSEIHIFIQISSFIFQTLMSVIFDLREKDV